MIQRGAEKPPRRRANNAKDEPLPHALLPRSSASSSTTRALSRSFSRFASSISARCIATSSYRADPLPAPGCCACSSSSADGATPDAAEVADALLPLRAPRREPVGCVGPAESGRRLPPLGPARSSASGATGGDKCCWGCCCCCGFGADAAEEAVEATEAEWARRTESSRVRRFTCLFLR
jgi:hypothetical protein